jgi:hypothetical protein
MRPPGAESEPPDLSPRQLFLLVSNFVERSFQPSTLLGMTLSLSNGRRCVGSGTETLSFVLNKVVPVGRSTETTVGTTGSTTTTTTTYALVPDEKVEIQSHMGHKVEVTGVMIPAGDSKTTTTTKVEREVCGRRLREAPQASPRISDPA